ncbi:MAG: rhomboid family intramembrane serine protease [Xanthomonadales bacterium]|nr:rhomboid family intramembrane serine protease [Xanthomonadales bacterium]
MADYWFRTRKPSRVPLITLALAAVMLVVAGLQATRQWDSGLLQDWGLVPRAFWDGQAAFWRSGEATRMISALFLHAGWAHLLGNLVYLALFAPRVELAMRRFPFLCFVLFCGVLANLFAAYQDQDSLAPIVGMSGMVSAVMGAFLAFFPRDRVGIILPLGLYFQFIRIPATALIGSWFLFQVLYTFFGDRLGTVAWWTHIAGFVSAFLLALPLRFLIPAGSRRR